MFEIIFLHTTAIVVAFQCLSSQSSTDCIYNPVYCNSLPVYLAVHLQQKIQTILAIWAGIFWWWGVKYAFIISNVISRYCSGDRSYAEYLYALAVPFIPALKGFAGSICVPSCHWLNEVMERISGWKCLISTNYYRIYKNLWCMSNSKMFTVVFSILPSVCIGGIPGADLGIIATGTHWRHEKELILRAEDTYFRPVSCSWTICKTICTKISI